MLQPVIDWLALEGMKNATLSRKKNKERRRMLIQTIFSARTGVLDKKRHLSIFPPFSRKCHFVLWYMTYKETAAHFTSVSKKNLPNSFQNQNGEDTLCFELLKEYFEEAGLLVSVKA